MYCTTECKNRRQLLSESVGTRARVLERWGRGRNKNICSCSEGGKKQSWGGRWWDFDEGKGYSDTHLGDEEEERRGHDM